MILEHKKYDLFGKMIFEKAIIEAPFKKPNLMLNEACFLFIIEGVALSIAEVERLEIQAKESVLMKCGNYISKMLPSQSSKKYQAIAVHFHPDVLKKIYANELPKFLQSQDKSYGESSMVRVKSDKLIMKYIDSILFYFENPQVVNEELLILKLKELILLLDQTKNTRAVRQILSALFSPETYSLQQIIEAHIFSDISSEDLACLANLSLSSFKRQFKLIYNDSPARYIKNKKLERASQLLHFSDKRIGDIAYECGFNDLAHFSKSFQGKYNISPTNFRLNQKTKTLI
jgi:AraC family transcriptional regulator, exoenzyme S synthesis regulatory protein ExsA